MRITRLGPGSMPPAPQPSGHRPDVGRSQRVPPGDGRGRVARAGWSRRPPSVTPATATSSCRPPPRRPAFRPSSCRARKKVSWPTPAPPRPAAHRRRRRRRRYRGWFTELVIQRHGAVQAYSMNIGCVRLTERFLPRSARRRRDRRYDAFVDGDIDAPSRPCRCSRPREVALWAWPAASPPWPHCRWVSPPTTATRSTTGCWSWRRWIWCATLAARTQPARAERPGMVAGRADVIVGRGVRAETGDGVLRVRPVHCVGDRHPRRDRPAPVAVTPERFRLWAGPVSGPSRNSSDGYGRVRPIRTAAQSPMGSSPPTSHHATWA